MGHSESKILFAEDQEQVDKVLEVIEDLPNLSKIVYFESRGITKYDNEKLISWDEFIKTGKEEYQKDPEIVTRMQDNIKSEVTAVNNIMIEQEEVVNLDSNFSSNKGEFEESIKNDPNLSNFDSVRIYERRWSIGISTLIVSSPG